MDEMLIKSRAIEHHITNLDETFAILHHFQMKLNPSTTPHWKDSGSQ